MRSLMRARHRRDDAGFTLIELLAVVSILALIAFPLAAGFILLLKSSGDVGTTFDNSADAQRIGSAWTKDVQSVDAAGVNSDAECQPLEPPTTAEVLLVTFSWDRVSTGGTSATSTTAAPVSKKTASWVAVGTGANLDIVRRYCENETTIDETVLGEHLGYTGAQALDVVHGPGGAGDQVFCPVQNKGTTSDPINVGETCTIVVDGGVEGQRFEYELEVSRRVPDMNGNVANALSPPPPTCSGLIGRNTYVTVSWTAPSLPPSFPGIDNYKVLAYTSPTGSDVASKVFEGGELLGDVTGLTNGVNYWFKIQAKNYVGWGPLSEVCGPVAPQPTAPDAPKVNTVVSKDGGLLVTWTHPGVSGVPGNNGGSAITSWHIYAKPVDGPMVGPQVITPGSATSGTITGLNNETKYQVFVAGVNIAGEGIWSDALGPAPYSTPYSSAVFVSPSGVDNNYCLLESPCKTVLQGFSRAKAQGRSQIIMAGGTYASGIVYTMNNITARGGFSNDLLDRPDVLGTPNPTIIQSAAIASYGGAGHTYAVLVSYGSNVSFDNITFQGGTAAAGKESIPVGFVSQNGGSLINCTVIGGTGDGALGVLARSSTVSILGGTITSGAPRAATGTSAYGVRAESSTVSIAGANITASAGATGYVGSQNLNAAQSGYNGGNGANAGGSGGGGGYGAVGYGGNGGGGGTGNGGWGGNGHGAGSGGYGGNQGDYNASGGGRGYASYNGGTGGATTAGTTNNAAYGAAYNNSAAGTGGNGLYGYSGGSGGGGGGGGAGCKHWTCVGSVDQGGGGGGGGGGGWGGAGGGGGGAAGGSFAVYSFNSTVTIDNSSVVGSGNGGTGGNGGYAQPGGRGGNGGSGGYGNDGGGGGGGGYGANQQPPNNNNPAYNGGDGGNSSGYAGAGGGGGGGGGGKGGDGGAGGGGAGGPSVALLSKGSGGISSAMPTASVSIGLGGVGGLGSPGGWGGISIKVLVVA